MDPTYSPFAPGAGTRPPELAGRDSIVEGARIAIGRAKLGLPARSQMLLGLRGVGKTVLLNHISEMADTEGYLTLNLEAREGQALAELLVAPLRSQLFRLSRLEGAKHVGRRALGVLRAFASAFKLQVGDIEFGVEPEVGTADTGRIEADLPELLVAVAQAAREAQRPVALFIDEIQYLSGEDLSALIVAIHKIGQKALPFVMFGAGLPQLAALAGEAKSYAERLFDYPEVGALNVSAARDAIRAPLEKQNVFINDDALQFIAEKTRGYPYFLQEWGSHTWNAASQSPITRSDAERATVTALQALDKGFFRVRFDRLTPREKDYVRAMAELGGRGHGPGPYRSGDIAKVLGIRVNQAGPLRDGLIKKGMIYSPQHGDTAFTVPMFDEFMRRSMPEWEAPGVVPAAPSVH